MASTKKAAAPAAEETLEPVEDVATDVAGAKEAEEAAAPVKKDAWDETVEMIVPRKPKGEEQQEYICINDRRFTVPTDGKMHKLPLPVAEILQQHIDAEYEADDFADSQVNVQATQPIATL